MNGGNEHTITNTPIKRLALRLRAAFCCRGIRSESFGTPPAYRAYQPIASVAFPSTSGASPSGPDTHGTQQSFMAIESIQFSNIVRAAGFMAVRSQQGSLRAL
jgi:hypothetical protein